MRARWAAFVAVFAAAAGIALIPVFLHRSAHPRPARSWIDALPQQPSGSLDSSIGAVLATAPNGEQLIASRERLRGTRAICFFLGAGGGGGCGPVAGELWQEPLSSKHIALIGRTTDRRGVGWWGLVGGEVRSVRVLYRDGSQRRFPVRRGFVVFGDRVNPPLSVTAFDAAGAPLGKVDRGDQAETDCTPSSCTSVEIVVAGS